MAFFKESLKYLRIRENLSQSELADKLGVSKSTISMYEVGNREPNFDTLEEIANLFNVDMNFLFRKDGSDKNNYFLNDETARIAKEIFDNPDLHMIFNMARYISPKRLKALIEFMKCFTDQEPDNNDEGC